MNNLRAPPTVKDFEAIAAWLLGAISGFAAVHGYVGDGEITVTPFESGVNEPVGK